MRDAGSLEGSHCMLKNSLKRILNEFHGWPFNSVEDICPSINLIGAAESKGYVLL